MVYLTRLESGLWAEFNADWPSVGVGLEDANPVIRVVVRTPEERAYHTTTTTSPVRARIGRPGIHTVGSAL